MNIPEYSYSIIGPPDAPPKARQLKRLSMLEEIEPLDIHSSGLRVGIDSPMNQFLGRNSSTKQFH